MLAGPAYPGDLRPAPKRRLCWASAGGTCKCVLWHVQRAGLTGAALGEAAQGRPDISAADGDEAREAQHTGKLPVGARLQPRGTTCVPVM